MPKIIVTEKTNLTNREVTCPSCKMDFTPTVPKVIYSYNTQRCPECKALLNIHASSFYPEEACALMWEPTIAKSAWTELDELKLDNEYLEKKAEREKWYREAKRDEPIFWIIILAIFAVVIIIQKLIGL
jgi:hypothetical protein